MSEKVSAKITLNRKEIEDTIQYLKGAANNIYHVNHALFDTDYKSKLDWNNNQDLRYIKMTLFMAVASINREIKELENQVSQNTSPLIVTGKHDKYC